MLLTRAQREALHIKYEHDHSGAKSYREFRRRVRPGPDCIMVPWCNMWLGIEADGYTHS